MKLTKHFTVFVLLAAGLRGAEVGTPRDAALLAQTGAELARAGRLAEAAEALQQALTMREQAQPNPDPQELAQTLNDLGVVYRLEDRSDDAARLYQRAL